MEHVHDPSKQANVKCRYGVYTPLEAGPAKTMVVNMNPIFLKVRPSLDTESFRLDFVHNKKIRALDASDRPTIREIAMISRRGSSRSTPRSIRLFWLQDDS